MSRPHKSQNDPDLAVDPIPPHSEEAAPLGKRIAETIGNEPRAAFARRAGIGESSLRDYISGKKTPGLDAAKLIADAGGVMIEWLATGRWPKYRKDPDAPHMGAVDIERLAFVIAAMDRALSARPTRLSPLKRAHLIALAYDYHRIDATGKQASTLIARLLDLVE